MYAWTFWLIIVVVLVFFGKRLPGMVRMSSRAVAGFKEAWRSIDKDVKNTVAEIDGRPVLPSGSNGAIENFGSNGVSAQPTADQLSPEHAANLSDAELMGRITPSDVARAGEEARSHNCALQEASALRRGYRLRLIYVCLKGWFAAAWVKIRSLASLAPLGRVGAAFISATLIIACAVVAAVYFTLDGKSLLVTAMFGLAFAGGFVTRLFYPSDESLTKTIASAHQEAGTLRLSFNQASQDEKAALGRYNQAQQLCNRLGVIAQSRTHRLLTTDWRLLRGHPFEDFLQAVFENLGYHVDRTKTTGDQGADLILTRDGVKIAVQAKGYADSVGNGAVQEALAGMGFYMCQHCAVITTSMFTSSARELAGRINCTLIDGNQIPDLIRGKINVEPAVSQGMETAESKPSGS
jgi:restriction system protein